MDAATEKLCLEEISHTILDSQEKITVRSISNNWKLSFNDSSKILEKWLNTKSSKEFSKEYIIRGVDKQGNVYISVVPEEKLKVIESKLSKFSKVLYSAETPSNSNRLAIPDTFEFKVINLQLKCEKRDILSPPPIVEERKPDVKPKTKNLFGASNSAKPSSSNSTPDEKEKKNMVQNVKTEKPVVKEEKKTPEKVSPKSPNNKKTAKSQKPAVKGSIASFFSNKPASKPAVVKEEQSTPVKKEEPTPVKEEKPTPVKKEKRTPVKEEIPTPVKKVKQTPDKEKKVKKSQKEENKKSNGVDEPKTSNGNNKEKSRKRTFSEDSTDEVIPSTPQEKKSKTKKGAATKKSAKKANPTKRSRILAIVDTSESEDEEHEAEVQEECIKFDEDLEMDEKNDKPIENDPASNNKNKYRIRKLVTKSFMDDDGYMTTIKEYEMQTASEDEEIVEVKEEKETKKTPKAAAPTKEKSSPPTPKTKQGSIMSFFSKK